jgi:hypothetical protein
MQHFGAHARVALALLEERIGFVSPQSSVGCCAIDDQHLHGSPRRLQVQSELFLKSGKERWTVGLWKRLTRIRGGRKQY